MINFLAPRFGRRFWMICLTAVALAAAGALQGCAPIGVAAYMIGGADTQKAKYVPGKEPVLVMVENFANPGLDAPSDELTQDIVNQFVANKAGDVIYPDMLMELRNKKGETFSTMSIPEIGKALGAAQVLYVDLTKYQITTPPSSDIIQATIAARVKIVDVATGKTLWPIGSVEGYPMSVEDPIARRSDSVNEDVVRQQKLIELSENITRLFYNYKPDFDKAGD